MERELRVLARRPRTQYARSLAALIVAFISLGMLYAGFGGALSATSAGRELFVALSLLGYGFVLLDGAFSTADCLSHEKREGTMGLLFLTDLKGYDVIAGKLVSRSANGAYCVLAALPALGLAIFLGGVTGADFFRMTLVLMNGLFFSVAFGLFISACCRSERQALSGALSGVIFFGLILPVTGYALMHWRKALAIDPLFLMFSPAGSWLGVLNSSVGGASTAGFGGPLLSSHLLGWTFLALASVILPRAWQDRIHRSKASTLSLARRVWNGVSLSRMKASPGKNSPADAVGQLHSPARPPTHRARWLEINPMIWLGERPGRRGMGVAAILICFTLAWIGGLIANPKEWLSLPICLISAVLLHLILMYATAVEACRGPAEDRHTGVMELLLTTPLGDEAILRGRLLGLKRRLVRPVLFVLAADLALLAVGCWQLSFPNWEVLGWIALFAALIVRLFVDLYALCWVGVWQGFKAKSTPRAIRQTLFYVVILQWLLLFITIAVLGLLTQGRIFRLPVSGVFAVICYFAMLAETLLHFCGLAMSELKDDLRVLAARQDVADREQFAWWPFSSQQRSGPRLIASLNCLKKLRVRPRS
jgi:hypothetical protein